MDVSHEAMLHSISLIVDVLNGVYILGYSVRKVSVYTVISEIVKAGISPKETISVKRYSKRPWASTSSTLIHSSEAMPIRMFTLVSKSDSGNRMKQKACYLGGNIPRFFWTVFLQ